MVIEFAQREKVDKLLQAAEIPTLPMAARKLVDLCKDDTAHVGDLVRLLETDQGLASRVLRVANSAYYGMRHKASTLDRAVIALGFEYVKSIALGFHLAHNLHRLSLAADFDATNFWRQNLSRGILARQLAAQYCAQGKQEAFLIGLLQDSGILLLAQVLGKNYLELYRDSRTSPICLYRLERQLFEIDHVKAISVLADRWSLPEVLSQPLRSHHSRGWDDPCQDLQVQLSQIGYFVGSFSLNDPESLCGEDLALSDYCQNTFALSPPALNQLLDQMREEFVTVAQMFTGILSEKVDITDLVVQAKNLLSDFANDANRKIFDLEKEVKQLRLQREDITSRLNRYQYRAETDDLTGLTRRIPLENYIDKACRKVRRRKASLGILFIDIDNFKTINDRHSHAAGDRVLQWLANLIRKEFSAGGCVSRYGGDEFVIALLGQEFRTCLQTASGLLRKVQELKIPVRSKQEARTIHISCSIGLLFCESGSKPGNSIRVLELADNQMREAKRHGKNNVRFQVIGTIRDSQLTSPPEADA
jgi:diguanylate cyclase (GGDEF)-like protein